jgi:hypothetical protein
MSLQRKTTCRLHGNLLSTTITNAGRQVSPYYFELTLRHCPGTGWLVLFYEDDMSAFKEQGEEKLYGQLLYHMLLKLLCQLESHHLTHIRPLQYFVQVRHFSSCELISLQVFFITLCYFSIRFKCRVNHSGLLGTQWEALLCKTLPQGKLENLPQGIQQILGRNV